jgi:hypothetical protein
MSLPRDPYRLFPLGPPASLSRSCGNVSMRINDEAVATRSVMCV